MKRPLIIIFSALLACSAFAKINLEKYHAEIIDMTVDENINHPEVPKKLVPSINAHMALLAGEFMAADNVKVDLTERNGMVLMLTIPASELFLPNDTIIRPEGEKYIAMVADKMKVPDQYKLLVTVHSDNTGSDDYLSELTRMRAEAIVDSIISKGVDPHSVLPYGIGNDEPVSQEQTRAGRAANRRIELYFIPGPALIDAPQKSVD